LTLDIYYRTFGDYFPMLRMLQKCKVLPMNGLYYLTHTVHYQYNTTECSPFIPDLMKTPLTLWGT